MAVTNFIWNELTDNVMFETDENDAVTVSYTNLPEQFGELLSQKRNGVTSYYHYDGEHSTRQLTDENQNVTDTFIYSAFGEEIERTGATTNPFGYKGAVGYYTNSATNDIYVRARTYQPVTGRWLSMDPLGFVDGPNLYRPYFVPVGIDPFGLLCITGKKELKLLFDKNHPMKVGALLGVPIWLEFRSELYMSAVYEECEVCCDSEKKGVEGKFSGNVKLKLFGALTWGFAGDWEWEPFHIRFWLGLRGEIGGEAKGEFNVLSKCSKKTCAEVKVSGVAFAAIRFGGEATINYKFWSWSVAVNGNLEGRIGFSAIYMVCSDGTVEAHGFKLGNFEGRAFLRFCAFIGCYERGFNI